MLKGFFTFSVIYWFFSIVSNFPAALTLLTIICLSAFLWWYKSTIHLTCKVFITKRTRETFTSAGAMSSLSCFEISFTIQVLYISETYAFAALLTLRSSSSNLLNRLWGMITISQSFLAQDSLKSSLPCPLNISIITSDIFCFGYAKFSLILSKYGKISYSKCSVTFYWFDQWFLVYVT